MNPALIGETGCPIDFAAAPVNNQLLQRDRVEEGLDRLPALGASVDLVTITLDLHLEQFPALHPGFFLQPRDRLPILAGARFALYVAVRVSRLRQRQRGRSGERGQIFPGYSIHAILRCVRCRRLRPTERKTHASARGARWISAGCQAQSSRIQ